MISRIRIFLPVSDPGSGGSKKYTVSGIRNTAYYEGNGHYGTEFLITVLIILYWVLRPMIRVSQHIVIKKLTLRQTGSRHQRQ
jgi:hypothetical protein